MVRSFHAWILDRPSYYCSPSDMVSHGLLWVGVGAGARFLLVQRFLRTPPDDATLPALTAQVSASTAAATVQDPRPCWACCRSRPAALPVAAAAAEASQAEPAPFLAASPTRLLGSSIHSLLTVTALGRAMQRQLVAEHWAVRLAGLQRCRRCPLPDGAAASGSDNGHARRTGRTVSDAGPGTNQKFIGPLT